MGILIVVSHFVWFLNSAIFRKRAGAGGETGLLQTNHR